MIVVTILGALCITLAVAGIVYQCASAIAVWRTLDQPAASAGDDAAPAVTMLKPLHGLEPKLAANLSGFVTQGYPGPQQIVFGVSDADDAALASVATLRAAHPDSRSRNDHRRRPPRQQRQGIEPRQHDVGGAP